MFGLAGSLRELKGLQDVISFNSVDFFLDRSVGWKFCHDKPGTYYFFLLSVFRSFVGGTTGREKRDYGEGRQEDNGGSAGQGTNALQSQEPEQRLAEGMDDRKPRARGGETSEPVIPVSQWSR